VEHPYFGTGQVYGVQTARDNADGTFTIRTSAVHTYPATLSEGGDKYARHQCRDLSTSTPSENGNMDHSDSEPKLEPTLEPTVDSHIGSQSEPTMEPTNEPQSGSDSDMIHGDDQNDDNNWMYIVIAICGLFVIFCMIEGMVYVQRWKKSHVHELQTAKMVDDTSCRSKTDTRRTASEIDSKDGSIEVTTSD